VYLRRWTASRAAPGFDRHLGLPGRFERRPRRVIRIAGGLDAVRRTVLLTASSWFGPSTVRAVHRDRDVRLGLTGLSLSAFALLVAFVSPMFLLAFGPLMWGVPHLVSDVRYLVARPRIHVRPEAWLGAAGWVVASIAGLGVRATLLAAAMTVVAMAFSDQRFRAKRIAISLGLVGLASIAWLDPYRADVLFVHAHNVVAIALWAVWRSPGAQVPKSSFMGTRAAIIGFFVIGTMALALAPLPKLTVWGDLDMRQLGAVLNPTTDPALDVRFACFFAFAQAVHYVVWLHLLPQDAEEHGAPRSFAKGLRALVADVGRPVLLVATVAMVVPIAVAIASLRLSRDVYLGIAFFHAHLELLVAAMFLAGVPLRAAAPKLAPAAP
jgi:hypothetical protein